MNATNTIPELSEKDKERFFSKVKTDDSGCHLWKAGSFGNGYGAFKVAGITHPAHRVAYAMLHGEIPNGLFVCHKCDVPLCCNPGHLFVGTQKENLADRNAKGRANYARGDRHGWYTHPESVLRGDANGNSKLTKEAVLSIRARYSAGGVSQRSLAREFGASSALVHLIIHRKVWAHIP